ncbi:MAG: hypothetical protein LUI39_06340 [Lachnospiraceae bacterium]|nr:hypothetical protein [Lachnospiraceae bacterium]
MTKKPTSSDIYDVNKKTGALILGKNRLDDYARKFLQKNCKEALETPMPLPVDKILQDLKLTVAEASLSRNLDVFGCCLLLDGEVDVYDRETGSVKSVWYPAGTILIDPESEAMYGEGTKRNTLIHEALHWEKDKAYFKILALKNAEDSEELYPIMCRQSETYYEPPEGKKTKANEVKWLEWQAHRLAPRILMPKSTFRQKAMELLEEQRDSASCDELIESLSQFFVVSRSSAKYRLLEVGMESTISQLPDYTDVFADILERNDFQKLDALEAFRLMNANPTLKRWIDNGDFVFADGYFVLASSKYVTFKSGKPCLTSTAKRNLQKCVLNIQEHRWKNYKYAQEDLEGLCCFYRTAVKAEDIDKRILLFNPRAQANLENLKVEDSYKAAYASIPAYDEDEECELLGMLGNPGKSLCDCLWFLMERHHWTAPSTFAEHTGLHPNYHGKIKNNQFNKVGTDNLMAICVGLRLRLRIIEKIFEKSANTLDAYHEPTKTYVNILERFPGISLNDFNGMLAAAKLTELGTKEKNS